MVSALGLDAITSCAAARAGVCRLAETDDLFVEDIRGAEVAPVSVHRVPRISSGLFGYGRLLSLALAALADLQRSTTNAERRRSGLIVVSGDSVYQDARVRQLRQTGEATTSTPENAAEADGIAATVQRSREHLSKELLGALVAHSGLDVAPHLRVTIPAGAVGVVAALRQAEDWLVRRECDCCIVGGVDSLIDPAILAAIDGLGLLRVPNRAVGMFPGEAACFLLLMRAPDVTARREQVAAFVDASATAHETAHPLVGLAGAEGGGLRAAITEAVARLPDRGADIGLAIANLNGDPYRSFSWGRITPPGAIPIPLGSFPLWLPPLHFGDVGAATGPVSIAMAAHGWARNYAPRSSALVGVMDDAGARGVFCVRAPGEAA